MEKVMMQCVACRAVTWVFADDLDTWICGLCDTGLGPESIVYEEGALE